jgi:hypothetical protein
MTIAIKVECYAGYRADQRPQRFTLGADALQVMEVQDQWYDPNARYFKVLAGDGNTYILRHDELTDTWTLEAFRSGCAGPPFGR